MKAKEIEVGGRYVAKVSNVLCVVRIVDAYAHFRTNRTNWKAINERTGRPITVRSAARFRRRA